MIIRERRESGKRVLEVDAEGLRAITCAGTESSNHAPYSTVALPAGGAFDSVRMVTAKAAPAKDKHKPIPGAEIGQPEAEGTP